MGGGKNGYASVVHREGEGDELGAPTSDVLKGGGGMANPHELKKLT